MDSDDYFDDELPSAILHEFDAIDAAYSLPVSETTTVVATPSRQQQPAAKRQISLPKRQSVPQKKAEVVTIDDSDEFGEFDVDMDEETFVAIDQACRVALNGNKQKAGPVAGPSKSSFARTNSRATVQTTLTGGVVDPSSSKKPASAASRSPVRRRTSSAAHDIIRGKPKKTKQWDHTAFAKTGWKAPKDAKGKERGTGSFDGEEEEEEEEVEFEQFPAPFVPVGPPPPMKLEIDKLSARRWLFPLNQPKRDYQFNIVRKCLFENTLVALPTGLGKTFIAGVVMLNFYTWFPEGKVVFVAPTKPLVAQQIDACHRTCGIPGSHAAELTGQNSRKVRAEAWKEKRVFYMTPQTLMNDLKTDNCDPQDIVLLVIDEAHKGVGDYAYAQVVRFLMAKNPHFRLMALTATPGSKPEAVQAIVDALHISHIEIRDEHSLDLKAYIHKKHIKQHIICMDEDIAKVRDLLSEAMTPMIIKLSGSGVLEARPNAVMLHPYSCSVALQRSVKQGKQWAMPLLSRLGALARAMGYLLESSVPQCYNTIHELLTAPPKGKQKKNQAAEDPKIQAVLQELEVQKARGFGAHPKQEKLKALLIDHFAQKRFDFEDATANGHVPDDVTGDSRVMVFCSFRQGVEEVVEFLKHEEPMIRPVPFIGQGTDKSGKKGYGQKEQLAVIEKFKAGTYNVLVSTSIGEEGLDIGEIDVIVCYEAQKTPIRMLQRVGRTGRKRDGYVHVLLSETREERNWDKANEGYEDVQRFIIRAEQLELYGDVERLVPPEIQPTCVELTMEIEPYVRDEGPAKRVPKSPRAKKTKDPGRNIPTGAFKSFVTARELVPRKPIDLMALPDADSDSDDRELEAGIHGPRRTVSMPSASSKGKKKGLRRTATTATGKAKSAKAPKQKSKAKKPLPDLLSIVEDSEDDEADAELEAGIFGVGGSKRAPIEDDWTRASTLSGADDRLISPLVSPTEAAIDLTTLPEPLDLGRDTFQLPPSSPDVVIGSPPTVEPSSLVAHHGSTSSTSPRESFSDQGASTSSRSQLLEQSAKDDVGWLVDDDDFVPTEPADDIVPPPRRGFKAREDVQMKASADEDIPVAPYDDDEFNGDQSHQHEEIMRTPHRSPARGSSSGRPSKGSSHARNAMLPPPLPVRFTVPSTPPPRSSPEVAPPEPSFAVRGPTWAKKRSRDAVDSSPIAMLSPARRRLQRGRSRSPDHAPDDEAEAGTEKPKRKKRKFRDVVEAQRHNPWIDVEAAHSGDELTDGGSEGDELGSESDRHFVQDLPATQASPSYDQTAVYRRSLMTQAPGGSMPAFAHRPLRRGGYVFAAPARAHAPVELSSSPVRQDSDNYEFDSFIVGDDEEIVYNDESTLLSDD